uniref:Uncharacterized protein LOC105044423 isoform X3 n=1 Tax=Elaeis guineensis var. tenera TaxID=51953 RepID=A0A6I9R4S1_ELAGV|nr:uncharacterized protein LOC105044423 isoform X3 [Elaeis guineensis]
MLGLGFQRPRRSPWELLRSAAVSFFLALLSHIALAMVPRLFPSLSLLSMLPISAFVLVATIFLGKCWRRLLGISASAPAFVLFNILFLWGVYVAVIRGAIPSILDAILNAECALLVFGFYKIFSSDPGMVAHDSSCSMESEQKGFSEFNLQYEKSPLFSRVRYCNICKTSIRGFDHHCPAFGNCIEHHLWQLGDQHNTVFYPPGAMAGGLPSVAYLLHLLKYQNRRINWRKYPEFQLIIQPQPGSPTPETRFTNPYDKGFIGNMKDFFKPKD